jgi:hypothetical protein
MECAPSDIVASASFIQNLEEKNNDQTQTILHFQSHITEREERETLITFKFQPRKSVSESHQRSEKITPWKKSVESQNIIPKSLTKAV